MQDRLPGKCSILRRILDSDIPYLITLLVINLWWFLPLMERGIIMGDDIGVLYGRELSLLDAITLTGDKYRPVYMFFSILTAHLFADVYELYFFLNLALNLAVCTALYYLVKRVTGGSRLLSFGIAVLFTLCPFITYNVVQLIGFMEGLCLFLLLVVFHLALSYYCGNKKAIYYAVAVSVLLTFTHERYVVIAPWLTILVLCAKHEKMNAKALKALLCLLPLGINIFLKEVLFDSNFLVGTGGTNVTFDFQVILNFFFSGLLSMFGMNLGPEYLLGIGFSQYPIEYQMISVLTVCCSFALLFLYLFQRIILTKDNHERISEMKCLLLAAAAIGALLLSGCVTIRLEQRWISAPFIAYLVYLGYLISRIRFPRPKVSRAVLFSVLVGLTVSVNLLQHSAVGQIYFFRAMYTGSSFYKAAIEPYGDNLADYDVYIIGNNELQWAVGAPGLSMFDVYLEEDVSFTYADSLAQIKQIYNSIDQKDRKPAKIFLMDPMLNVTEVSALTLSMHHESTLAEYKYTISPSTPAETPTGEGVFFNSSAYFTVLSGYTADFHDVILPENSIMYLECSMPYDISDGAYVTVTLMFDGTQETIAAFPICPEQDYETGLMLIELENRTEMTCDVSISVLSPTGDDMADWVVFQNGGIYTND